MTTHFSASTNGSRSTVDGRAAGLPAQEQPYPSVALVHDYLTQRGGAERVVLSMLKAFPGSPLHTSLFDPPATFRELASATVVPLPINRIPVLRRHHRLALPALASAFSRHTVQADVVLCSSSGWAHGVRAEGAKVVYCYTPARWLYDTERYTNGWPLARAVTRSIRGPLVRWDRRAAASADRYLTSSHVVRRAIHRVYGIDAEVLPPPPALDPSGDDRPVPGLEAGFVLCVSRLLPYKNVDAVSEAFRSLPAHRLVVIGDGPERDRLRRDAPRNVSVLGKVDDAELRWLYRSCRGVVAAGYEDFGLTPLEGATFGKPSAVLSYGGYLETVVAGETGLYFAKPEPAAIARAVDELARSRWSPEAIRAHAATFAEHRFISRLREVVAEVQAG